MSKQYITSISLDEETHAIAHSMPNRSAFVRECFRRWYQHEHSTHLHPTETNRCYPMSKKGRCTICWPNGIPSSEDWKYYRESGRYGQPYADSWIDEQIITTEFPVPAEWSRKTHVQVGGEQQSKGFFARFWRRFRA